ncbi:MAG: hypothetical protein M0Z81_19270 [Deltaproteobacteria bacterium]|jgi:hypothetical protein|nr:hypothetical protein [Deltaproteobacteria bacterium]
MLLKRLSHFIKRFTKDAAPVIARSLDIPAAYNSIFKVRADTPYTVNYLSELEVFGYKPEFSLDEGTLGWRNGLKA